MDTYAARRNALADMVMNIRYPAKDPIAKMRKLTIKHGALAATYHCAAYEAGVDDCIANHEKMADAIASKANGWKTLESIRDESFRQLQKDMAE